MKVGDRVKYWNTTYNFGIGEVQSFMQDEDKHVYVEFQNPEHSGWFHEYNLILVDADDSQTKA